MTYFKRLIALDLRINCLWGVSLSGDRPSHFPCCALFLIFLRCPLCLVSMAYVGPRSNASFWEPKLNYMVI